MKRLALLITVAAVVAVCAEGCDSSKEQELQLLQEKNQELTQRVAELESQLESLEKTNQSLVQLAAELRNQLQQAEAEDQLRQAESIAPITKTDIQPHSAESIYTVVEGDSLWIIAEEQFGDGNRYTEILTLNPQIEEDKPLFVGTKLKIPTK
jgi:nucleoid-associated protein YgaU